MSGVNNPNFGKNLSAETKAKLSEAFSGENHPMFGKTHSVETTTKMSEAQEKVNRSSSNNHMAKKVYVYSNDNPITLILTFNTQTEAANHFKCSNATISFYIDTNKLYKKKLILSSSMIESPAS
jgi:group I intron endonuclease